MSFEIDLANPANLSQKVLTEQETRKRLILHARLVGCEGDMRLLFNKYDKLLRNCSNEKERKDIAKMGGFEMFSLLGKSGELYIDNELVYTDKK